MVWNSGFGNISEFMNQSVKSWMFLLFSLVSEQDYTTDMFILENGSQWVM